MQNKGRRILGASTSSCSCASIIAWLMIWISLRRLGVRHAASIDTAAPAHQAGLRQPLEAAQPAQRLQRRLRLRRRLPLVVEVLQIAASAHGEMGAGRNAAARARGQHLDDVSPPEVRMALDHAHAQTVPGSGQRDEERRTVGARQTLAAGDQLLHRHLDLVEASERAGDVGIAESGHGLRLAQRARRSPLPARPQISR